MNRLSFLYAVLVVAISTGFAQIDTISDNKDERQKQLEYDKIHIRIKTCDGFVCTPPQVCRTVDGIPGCFEEPTGRQSPQEELIPVQIEPEIKPERAYLQTSQQGQGGPNAHYTSNDQRIKNLPIIDPLNLHLTTPGYNWHNQHHTTQGRVLFDHQRTPQYSHNPQQSYDSSNLHRTTPGYNTQHAQKTQEYNPTNPNLQSSGQKYSQYDRHTTPSYNQQHHGFSVPPQTPQGHNAQYPQRHDSLNLHETTPGYSSSHDTHRTTPSYNPQHPHHPPQSHDPSNPHRAPQDYNSKNTLNPHHPTPSSQHPHPEQGPDSPNIHRTTPGYSPQHPHQPIQGYDWSNPRSTSGSNEHRTTPGYKWQHPQQTAQGHDTHHNPQNPPQIYGTTPQPHHHGYSVPQPLYPTLHPSRKTNPGYGTTPQPYHKGYPSFQVNNGGHQQYFPAYPYQQNYGNFYPNQHAGFGGYRPTPAYTRRQY